METYSTTREMQKEDTIELVLLYTKGGETRL